ncbi:MAG TPA: hypothetical protein H9870_00405 [Candidatus Corynebacterium avicola]|uniref:Uncharacterized protein n=1 Tax=Candidatus Corynebacterium avicola TaxID=2838527 RepID=A0A9D1RMA6_9CORY|nr:hypothetical protein [Candidatus Corynebacterium avicola]
MTDTTANATPDPEKDQTTPGQVDPADQTDTGSDLPQQGPEDEEEKVDEWEEESFPASDPPANY